MSCRITRHNHLIWYSIKIKMKGARFYKLTPIYAQTRNPPFQNSAILLSNWPLQKGVNSTTEQFLGACVDIGSAGNVYGRQQLELYCEQNHTSTQYIHPNTTYEFDTHTYSSLGRIGFRIFLNAYSYIPIPVDIPETDVPLLIGLWDLKLNGLLPNYLEFLRFRYSTNTRILVRYKNRHVFMYLNYVNTYFTLKKITRLHPDISHPSTERLSNF